MSRAVVPTCFRTTTIFLVPKRTLPSCLNDYCTVQKSFRRLVIHHIRAKLSPTLNPFQFPYQANWAADDAISSALQLALTHLDVGLLLSLILGVGISKFMCSLFRHTIEGILYSCVTVLFGSCTISNRHTLQ